MIKSAPAETPVVKQTKRKAGKVDSDVTSQDVTETPVDTPETFIEREDIPDEREENAK